MTMPDERIETLRRFPDELTKLVEGLSAEQLTTAYNEPEWTIAQNVHHLADAHMNSFIRFKLILTEEKPALRPYEQSDWATLPDATNADVEASLQLLRGLHARWVCLLEAVDEWGKPGYHPELMWITLDDLLTHYADHCRAHLAQIQAVLDKMPSAE